MTASPRRPSFPHLAHGRNGEVDRCLAQTLHIRMARLFAALVGFGVAVFLVLDHGWQNVLHALQMAGWTAVGAITRFHALPTLICGLAWWLVLRPLHSRPSAGATCREVQCPPIRQGLVQVWSSVSPEG